MLEVRAALYQKHAPKRRTESSKRKLQDRERYTLLEWFRRQGVRKEDINDASFEALLEMKKALKASKEAAKFK